VPASRKTPPPKNVYVRYFRPAMRASLSLVVGDQRIGDQREQFVEDEDRHQVRREGDPDRS